MSAQVATQRWREAATAPNAALATNFDLWQAGIFLVEANHADDDRRLAEAVSVQAKITDATSAVTPEPPSTNPEAPKLEAQKLDAVISPPAVLKVPAPEVTVPAVATFEGSQVHTNTPIGPLSPFFTIRPSETGGLGAFACQDIPQNTKILWDWALVLATNQDLMLEFAQLSEADKEFFLSLHGYDCLHPNDRVASIFDTNKFRANPDVPSVSGLFPIAARFNHSCKPTCTYRYSLEVEELVFSTSKDIKVGEELTIDYGCGPGLTMAYYGFQCKCGSCPDYDPKAARATRRRLGAMVEWNQMGWAEKWREEGQW